MSGGDPLTSDDVIETLRLAPHPEGGYYAETWRDVPHDKERGSGSAIYYLLEGGPGSKWHRVDAVEIWHFYAGSPLELQISSDGHQLVKRVLGPGVDAGQRPQLIVPAHAWQSARSLGEWTLVGCTVSPAFESAGFELAPDDWRPTPPR